MCNSDCYRFMSLNESDPLRMLLNEVRGNNYTMALPDGAWRKPRAWLSFLFMCGFAPVDPPPCLWMCVRWSPFLKVKNSLVLCHFLRVSLMTRIRSSLTLSHTPPRLAPPLHWWFPGHASMLEKRQVWLCVTPVELEGFVILGQSGSLITIRGLGAWLFPWKQKSQSAASAYRIRRPETNLETPGAERQEQTESACRNLPSPPQRHLLVRHCAQKTIPGLFVSDHPASPVLVIRNVRIPCGLPLWGQREAELLRTNQDSAPLTLPSFPFCFSSTGNWVGFRVMQ